MGLAKTLVTLLSGARVWVQCYLLKTGQTTQYNSELDDGYYEMGVVKSYTVNTTGAQAGTTNIDLTHLVSDTGAFTSADKTYTDAGKCGVFKAAGGETIIISGSASNNGVFTTVSATANTVVFTEAITDEADAPSTTFKKRDAISNNTVKDNNTGLEWLRYQTTKLGILGTGVMPWTGKVYDIFQYIAECNLASLGGYSDWRMPNMFEAMSITDYAATSSYPDSTAFPALGTTIWVSNTKVDDNTAAMAIYFVNGTVVSYTKTTAETRTMLVRGG